MGDPTSTPVSNAFMTEFEIDALARYRLIHDPPPHTPPTPPPPISVILFWFRQADDTMTAIYRDHVASFLAFLNSIQEKIKWTFETEVDGCIDMLDLTILRQQDGTLEFDVYRKPTHTNQYISWDSDQPLTHKGSTIRSLTRRAPPRVHRRCHNPHQQSRAALAALARTLPLQPLRPPRPPLPLSPYLRRPQLM
jgi:hypothetical protein